MQQTEQLLCWNGMTDTKHTISGLNKEEWLNDGGYRIMDHIVCMLNVVNNVSKRSIKLFQDFSEKITKDDVDAKAYCIV